MEVGHYKCNPDIATHCVVHHGQPTEAIMFYAYKHLSRGTQDTRSFVVMQQKLFYTESTLLEHVGSTEIKGTWTLPIAATVVETNDVTLHYNDKDYKLSSKNPNKATDDKCNQAEKGTPDQLCPTAATIKKILEHTHGFKADGAPLSEEDEEMLRGIMGIHAQTTKAVGHAPYYNPEHFFSVQPNTKHAIAFQRTEATDWKVVENQDFTSVQIKKMFTDGNNVIVGDGDDGSAPAPHPAVLDVNDATLWLIADDGSIRFGKEHQELRKAAGQHHRDLICHGDLNRDITVNEVHMHLFRGSAKAGGEFNKRTIHAADGTEHADGPKWVIDNRTSFVGNRANFLRSLNPETEIERLRHSWKFMKSMGFDMTDVYIRDDIDKYKAFKKTEDAASNARFPFQTFKDGKWVDSKGVDVTAVTGRSG
eukprot:CAMPEP_0197517560 /NCGR_PEP_ID=MMETSP1318-20131121/2603_1 /TAXON_ID=552666 /ORGANISM="Partenskyella glossopodia, Strain RCC365" /LENGTH=420 /DNA_ID=CAMNT_0043067229 /DNA_START=195 /DNA_END=1457 /DNA_ORIENTATION=-